MFKFNIDDKVKIIELDAFDPQVYKIGKILTIRKRRFVPPFDSEPIYWFGSTRSISKIGLYESQLSAIK